MEMFKVIKVQRVEIKLEGEGKGYIRVHQLRCGNMQSI